MFLVVHLCVESPLTGQEASPCTDKDLAVDCSTSDALLVPATVEQLEHLFYENKDRDWFLNLLQQYVRNYLCNGLLTDHFTVTSLQSVVNCSFNIVNA